VCLPALRDSAGVSPARAQAAAPSLLRRTAGTRVMDMILILVLALLCLGGLPVMVASGTYRMTGWKMVVMFVVMWCATTIVGGIVYLVARAWYRSHRDTEPFSWTTPIEPVAWATPIASVPPGEPLALRAARAPKPPPPPGVQRCAQCDGDAGLMFNACPHCGADYPSLPARPEPQRACRACGRTAHASFNVCPHCRADYPVAIA
jgi:hypothetical protein